MSFAENSSHPIEGEDAKVFRLFTANIDGGPHECVLEVDDADQVRNFTRRADKRYILYKNRVIIDLNDFLAGLARG